MKHTNFCIAVLLMALSFFALYGGVSQVMESVSWAADTAKQTAGQTAKLTAGQAAKQTTGQTAKQTAGQTAKQNTKPAAEKTAKATQKKPEVPASRATKETPSTPKPQVTAAVSDSQKTTLSPPRSSQPTVWMVHGFQGLEQSFTSEFITLREIYQLSLEAPCITWRWPAPEARFYSLRGAWKKAIQNQRTAAEKLFSEIRKMPPEEQQQLILVGYSLGGGVVIHALAKCQQENIKIDHFLLLGAAIDNDDPDIELALKATTHCSYNLINVHDYALGVYRIMEYTPALGTGYAALADETKLCELAFEMENSHDALVYLENFQKCVEKNQYHSNGILVPQDWRLGSDTDATDEDEEPELQIAGWIPSLGLSWHDVEEKDGWVLQKRGFSHCSYYRILSPEKHTMARGWKTRMTTAFEKVKAQLAKSVPPQKTVAEKPEETPSTKPEAAPAADSSKPADGESADSTKPETTDTDERSWTEYLTGWAVWKTLDSHDGWKLQQKRFSDKCRILDPNGRKTAEGNEETLRSAFEQQKTASKNIES